MTSKFPINSIILKYNLYPLLQTWNTSLVPVSLNIIKQNLNNDGFSCKSKKFVGFYGVTKEDSIQYLKNSYPDLKELKTLTKNIENHMSTERFTDAYVNIMENPLLIHLWEYYPGSEFLQDELNGYALYIRNMKNINNSCSTRCHSIKKINVFRY